MERGFSNLLETDFITVFFVFVHNTYAFGIYYFGLVIAAFKILNIVSAKRMIGLTVTSSYYGKK